MEAAGMKPTRNLLVAADVQDGCPLEESKKMKRLQENLAGVFCSLLDIESSFRGCSISTVGFYSQ
ncbi:MAG: hypothetical protein IKD65_03915, partial [Oscillospiraceae bacterium]|nr:hypothetical protein [Oscillospiraceae bacterium]